MTSPAPTTQIVAPPPHGAPPPAAGRGTAARLGLAAAVVAAALGGGIAGSLLTNRSAPPNIAAGAEPVVPTHDADIKLCTRFVVINSALPNSDASGADLLAAATALEYVLQRSPDASPELREAMSAVAQTFYVQIGRGKNLVEDGLSRPPRYDSDAAQATYDRAQSICAGNVSRGN